MKIWIINNYNMLPKHGSLCRSYYLGKYLKRLGHEPTVFVGSHPHNTDLQLINDKSIYKISEECDFPWVLVKTINYEDSKVKRVFSMFQFYINMMKAAKNFEKPDVIIGSSAHPLAAIAANKLARKYGCKGVVEVRDLWPESIVAYGVANKSNPLIKLLYRLERWIYTKADKVIFTMEGGRDYIIEKGWDKEHGGSVDLSKVYHINNGVDLEVFNYNRDNHIYNDVDIDDAKHFNVVYTGAIKEVNGIDQLVDTAAILLKQGRTEIKLLIFGDGNKREKLEMRANELGLSNIVFKGAVSKDSIPSILSKADLCLLHWKPTPISNYGMSMNKFFEYLAAGKPILSNSKPNYDMVTKSGCGISEDILDSKRYASLIISFSKASKEDYCDYCEKAKKLCGQYNYDTLAVKLVNFLS